MEIGDIYIDIQTNRLVKVVHTNSSSGRVLVITSEECFKLQEKFNFLSEFAFAEGIEKRRLKKL